MKVLHFPLTKIALTFIFGILISKYINVSILLLFVFLVLGFLASLLFYFVKQTKAFSISILLLAFIVGFSNFRIQNQSIYKSHFTNQNINFDAQNTVTFQIKEKLKSSLNYNRYTAEVYAVNQNKSSGKIIVNFSKKHTPKLTISDFVKAQGYIYRNNKKSNPEGFDYNAYLENKNIFGQLYLAETPVLVSKNEAFTFTGFADKVNQKIEKNLHKSHLENQALQLVMALILGKQQELEPELVKEYQYAGAVHILSVSGLHIAFLLGFINLFLKLFPNTKKWRIAKLVFNLSFLWMFGLLAEFSPPVLRSITMFSILIIGNNINRNTNPIYNLMVSLLVLLLYNPRYLFDIGFQLSYAALFSILLFQPVFEKYWKPKNKFSKTIWQLITVSFAAQIGTFPISLYYFHQFPALFFVTNVFIYIPLGIGLFASFIAVLWAMIAPLPVFIGQILHYVFWFLNWIISKIASVESFVFQDVSFHFAMVVAMYILIVAFYFYLKKQSYSRLRNLLLAIILFQFTWLFAKYSTSKPEWIVFHKTGKTIVSSKKKNKVAVFTSISKNQYLKPVQDYAVARFSTITTIDSVANFYYFENKKIEIIDQFTVYLPHINPDVLILRNSPKLNLDRYLAENKVKQIVADGSNYKSYVKLWKTTCHKKKIPFHDTAEKGFYKLN